MPTIDKDAEMLSLALDGIRTNSLHPISTIYIVGPANSLKLQEIAKNKKCTFINEDSILPFSKDRIDYISNGENRSGWIYKMLLNLSADTVCKEENILILDSDTVFTKPQLFIHNGKPLFNLSDEFHDPYFSANSKIIGTKHRLSRSFITHYMIFNSKILAKLRSELELLHQVKWYDAIISNIERDGGSGFADYEIYGDFYKEYLKLPCILNYWSNISMSINNYRDIDNLIHKQGDKYHSVSLHNYNRN